MPKIDKIKTMPICKNFCTTIIFRQHALRPISKDNGAHITNNVKISSLSKLALNVVDKISPVIKRYPRFGNVILKTCEKLIKTTDKLSK